MNLRTLVAKFLSESGVSTQILQQVNKVYGEALLKQQQILAQTQTQNYNYQHQLPPLFRPDLPSVVLKSTASSLLFSSSTNPKLLKLVSDAVKPILPYGFFDFCWGYDEYDEDEEEGFYDGHNSGTIGGITSEELIFFRSV